MTLLEKLQTLKELQSEYRSRRVARWMHDPAQWVSDVLPEVELAPYQDDELSSLTTGSGKVAARGPRGSGKTMPAALAGLWFVTTRELAGVDWKCPVTAGSWQQLQRFTMPEIHKWARRMNWDTLGMAPWKPGQQLLLTRIVLDHGELFAINSDDPELVEGAHASHLMLIVDEAKSVPDGSWDAMEGYFSSPGEYYRFVISTPSSPAGRFYDIHSHKPGFEDWHTSHVKIGEAVQAGRVTQAWVDQLKDQWGEESQLYRCHVLAEFAGDEDGVIPLAWVEAAVERGKLVDRDACRPNVIGVDVADTGEDLTVFAFRHGDDLYKVESFGDAGPLLHAERVEQRAVNNTRVVLDSIGVGAGTRDYLQRVPTIRLVPFVAGAGTKRKDSSGSFRFPNKRSAAWWNMRDLLRPDNPHPISLPDVPELVGELTAPAWREVAGGKIQVEAKADIKKRIGRSTDFADAVVQAFWEETSVSLDGDLSALDGLGKQSTWRSH